MSQACKARAVERGGGRGGACTDKMVFKITIELGLKNRNPLFPELQTIAACYVVRRWVSGKERVTKSASPCPGSRDTNDGKARWAMPG